MNQRSRIFFESAPMIMFGYAYPREVVRRFWAIPKISSYFWCSDLFFFFSSRRRHTRFDCDWSSDVCSSDLACSIQRSVYLGLLAVSRRGYPPSTGDRSKRAQRCARKDSVREPRPTEAHELPEAETIQLAQRGDAAAFESLYRSHCARVFALCTRMLKNAAEAEDLTQEIFLHVFRKIHSFRGDSAFSTWLYRVSVNIVLMRLRRTTLAKTSLDEIAEAGETTGGSQRELGGPDLHLEGYIDRTTLQKAVDQLPPRFKAMFVLYDVQGYAHREIAKIRSEEHTSELQSQSNLVCRLLLEKKKKDN